MSFAGDALPHGLVHFAVPDVEAAASAAEATGGGVVGRDVVVGTGAARVVVEDPTGARFAVVSR